MRVVLLCTIALAGIFAVSSLPMSRVRQRNSLRLCTPELRAADVSDAMKVSVAEKSGTKSKLQQNNIWRKETDPAIPAFDWKDDRSEGIRSPKYLESNSAGHIRRGMNDMIAWAREKVQPSFKQMIKGFEASEITHLKSGTKVVAAIAKPKATDSAWAKVDRDYHVNYCRLIDAVRASMIYHDLNDMKEGLCRFSTYLTTYSTELVRDCKIVQLKDNTGAEGYKDINLSVQCTYGRKTESPHAYIAELQFHTCYYIMAKQGTKGVIREILKIPTTAPSWDAVKTQVPVPLWNLDANGHEMYEQSRVITDETSPVKLELKKKMIWLYSTAGMGSDAAKAACKVADAPKFDKFDEDHYWEDDTA